MHYRTGLLLLAVAGFHLVVLVVDGGAWDGPVSWRKPITFGVSFGLSVLTLTWISGFVRLGDRARRVLLGVFAAASVLEVGLTSMQAWRGVPSHFNLETTFDTVVARLLAVGGVTLIVVVVALTAAAFRAGDGSEMPAEVPADMRLAVRAGLVALVASMAFGAAMIARGLTLEGAGRRQAAYELAGSLRPAHAVTMHAVLLLPALAWLLRRSARPVAERLRLVRIATGSYVVCAVLVTVASVVGFGVLTPATAAAASAAVVVTPALAALAIGVGGRRTADRL
ncbi:hypothetical protein [Streptomyces cavernicola]|uniref:Uncharacterized protein n=1 Tax=Streptomyces cavernicola TaxID=3043613 RepID=A0ABT6SCW0_9ACTN|nr:hypothetical protein [Streptomyces sp. B-S-A6]MDI3405101.1 hypothetical protein [Streptomyces sp. B-S-A6]